MTAPARKPGRPAPPRPDPVNPTPVVLPFVRAVGKGLASLADAARYKGLASLADAARYLGGIHVNTVRRLIDRRELPRVKVGTRLMTTWAGLELYVEQHTAR